jgi:hypothetical protein
MADREGQALGQDGEGGLDDRVVPQEEVPDSELPQHHSDQDPRTQVHPVCRLEEMRQGGKDLVYLGRVPLTPEVGEDHPGRRLPMPGLVQQVSHTGEKDGMLQTHQ